MKPTTRFDAAIGKLYKAFINNTLNPECCKQCAVGNILNNTESWKNLSDNHGSLELNYVGMVNQKFGKKFNGYTPSELLQIEAVFLRACGYKLPLHFKNNKPKNPMDKDVLFKGLSEVITFLCQLDGIENIMDYTNLLNYKSTEPIYV